MAQGAACVRDQACSDSANRQPGPDLPAPLGSSEPIEITIQASACCPAKTDGMSELLWVNTLTADLKH